MPRTDPTRVRTAPFVVGPWRQTKKKRNWKKEENGGDVDVDATNEVTTRTTTKTSTKPLPPPPRASALEEESERYDSAWDEDNDDLDLIKSPKKLSGRGYLSFCSSSPSTTVAVSGHFVDASTSTAIGVSGVEIDPEGPDAGSLGASDLPHADACSFAAGDRLLSLALFLRNGRGGKKKGDTATEATEATEAKAAAAAANSRAPLRLPSEAAEETGSQTKTTADSRALMFPLATAEATKVATGTETNAPRLLPSAVVLALASGGDAAIVSSPAPDPTGQGARRLLLAVAAAASSKSSRSSENHLPLAPPRGVKPPRLRFECDTLLDGSDAEAYLRKLRVEYGSSSSSLIVNVGSFEIVGLGGEDDDGDKNDDEKNETTLFAAPARLSPSDPAYDAELDA